MANGERGDPTSAKIFSLIHDNHWQTTTREDKGGQGRRRAMTTDRQRRFGDLADDIAARLPDREGLVFGVSRYTFREIATRIDEAARRLIAAGVGHGEHEIGRAHV